MVLLHLNQTISNLCINVALISLGGCTVLKWESSTKNGRWAEFRQPCWRKKNGIGKRTDCHLWSLGTALVSSKIRTTFLVKIIGWEGQGGSCLPKCLWTELHNKGFCKLGRVLSSLKCHVFVAMGVRETNSSCPQAEGSVPELSINASIRETQRNRNF